MEIFLKTFYLLPILSVTVTPCSSQSGGLHDQLDQSVNPGLMLESSGPIPPNVIGNYLLSEEWQKATVKFYQSQKAVDFDIRFDIKQNHLQIREKNLYIRGENVEYFTLSGSRFFLNLREISVENKHILDNPTGFVLLAERSVYSPDLVIQYMIDEKKPNYNPALDIGNNSLIYELKKNRYLLKGNQLYLIPKKKKKLAALLGMDNKELSELLSTQSLDMSVDEDLRTLIKTTAEL